MDSGNRDNGIQFAHRCHRRREQFELVPSKHINITSCCIMRSVCVCVCLTMSLCSTYALFSSSSFTTSPCPSLAALIRADQQSCQHTRALWKQAINSCHAASTRRSLETSRQSSDDGQNGSLTTSSRFTLAPLLMSS